MSGKGKTNCPLPLKNGVDPIRIIPPVEFRDKTMGEFLEWRFPNHEYDWERLIAQDEIVFGNGKTISLGEIIKPGTVCYFHRDLPREDKVPYEQEILFEDENIVVVDKPPFLATIPRGSHVTETSLARLRNATGIDTISPVHRLDRLTAGVLLFVKRPEKRAKYHEIFEQRKVKKTYLAKAIINPDCKFPLQISNHIQKTPGIMRAFIVPGKVNAVTEINLLENNGRIGLYKLVPLTGKTHQLRLHMAGIGSPILNDPLYSISADTAVPAGIYSDYDKPLKLLAKRLEFIDPITGEKRFFSSKQAL